MIIVMQANADACAIEEVVKLIRSRGLQEHISHGQECTIIGAVGDERVFNPEEIERLPQVEKAIRIVHDWRRIGRQDHENNTIFSIRGIHFGADLLHAYFLSHDANAVQAEQNQQAQACLIDPFFVSENPYSYQNSHDESSALSALNHYREQSWKQGQILMVRIRDGRHIPAVLSSGADILYLGGEMIANRSILQEVGNLNVPVVLCKDKHHTVRDWLMAAEQVAIQGNQQLILGEAGTVNLASNHLRLDCDAIVQAKLLSHLPILADVSRLHHRYMPKAILCELAKAAGANIIIS